MSGGTGSRSPQRLDVAAANRAHYDTPAVADCYLERDWLFRAEETVLAHLRQEIAGRRLLDVGVGAGRTTPHLRALAGSYTGIDFSRQMLARCRAKFPDADLRLADARRLELFADASYDAACMSYHAIDDVSEGDRWLVLAELRRVLRPGGVLFFSAEDLDAAAGEGWPGAVAGQGSAVLMLPVREAPDGAPLPTCHVTRRAQVAQLAACGFERVEIVDPEGAFVGADAASGARWFYYIARRSVPAPG